MASSMAQPCAIQGIGRTMGREPQRISITLPLETLRADLREAFDVVDHRNERADAGE
jgi:hypothetical protein